MRQIDFKNLVLEAYAEVMSELEEAPAGLYYIEVSIRDARKALEILDDMYRKQFEINGSNVYYFGDPSTAYDAMMDLQASDIEVVDTNVEDENLDEATDINDPALIRFRAAQMARASKKDKKYVGVPSKNADKIAKLEKYRAQVMRDMEQEAELEGGPIADRYGEELEKIDTAIAKLKGKKLNESLLDQLSEEEEEPTPEAPAKENGAVLEDATDQILGKFPTLRAAIIKLQTEDFKEFVDTIDWISPRPTSFRINLKNGQDYILKWTGSTFEANILGKRYYINKIDDYQQALDKLAILYKEAPMKGAGEEGEGGDFDADTGGGGGGGGDFPGDDAAGGGGGDDLGGADFDDAGGDEGGEDLSDEPVDFESGEEG